MTTETLPIPRTTISGMAVAFRAAAADIDQAFKLLAGADETAYFRFRCFKNGNLHIEFKRLDLVARLNQVAGGARLKP